MNRKEFIAFVRKGDGNVRVDEVKISAHETTLIGSGTLECGDDRFVLHIRLPDGTALPEPLSGVVTRKDFWSVEGLIGHDLPFTIPAIPPCVSHTNSNGRLTLHLDAESIELASTGWDLHSYDEMRKVLNQLESGEIEETKGEAKATDTPSEQSNNCASKVEFSGLLPGFKLIDKDGQTTVVEENPFLGKSTSWKRDTAFGNLSKKWEFGLIQRGDDAEFHLRSRDNFTSQCEADDLRCLDAFLNALAFVHGQHAWPFTLEFRRDGRLITDRIKPFKIPAKTPHQPFTERIAFNAHVNGLEWNFEEALQKPFAFFLQESRLRDEVAELLFLCREAGSKSVHGKITNISVASLLESLVNAVFEEKLLKTPSPIICDTCL